jgi:putative ABC transport system permease protein
VAELLKKRKGVTADTLLRETRLILSDLRRMMFRTAAVTLSVAVLVSLLFSTSVLRVGSAKAGLAGSEKFGADIMVLPPITTTIFSYETATGPLFAVDQQQGYLNRTLVDVALRLPGIAEASPQLFVANLSRPGSGVASKLVAFDPKTDFVIKVWYAGPIGDLGDDQALAGPSTGMSVGDPVKYGGLNFHVAGMLKPTNSSLDETVLVPLRAIDSAASNGGRGAAVSAVLVRLTPGADLSSVETEIKGSFGSVKVVEASGLVSRVSADTTGLASYELLAETIVAASLFVMLVLVFSMTTNERGRQLGVLRCLGATRRFIFGNVLKEAALVAVIGSALGLALGEVVVSFGQSFLLANFNTPALGLDFPESVVLVASSALLGILTGTAASALPAYRVTKREPYEAIRRGE